MEGAMPSRDEYVQKLKSQIDQWNAQARDWEAKARDAGAAMRAQYEKQLEQYRARRDAAVAELRRLQGASADAWQEMMRGMDAAMKSMQEAFERARKSFDTKRDKQ
jgi:uncharacterized coiled-coil DUF342 family protein